MEVLKHKKEKIDLKKDALLLQLGVLMGLTDTHHACLSTSNEPIPNTISIKGHSHALTRCNAGGRRWRCDTVPFIGKCLGNVT